MVEHRCSEVLVVDGRVEVPRRCVLLWSLALGLLVTFLASLVGARAVIAPDARVWSAASVWEDGVKAVQGRFFLLSSSLASCRYVR